MNKKEKDKYTIDCTKEQLMLIGKACELSSRLRSGQLHELRYIIEDKTDFKYDREGAEAFIRMLKGVMGLCSNESIGIRQSTETAKKLYEIYYMIYHSQAKGISVYKNELLPVTEDKKIKITKNK